MTFRNYCMVVIGQTNGVEDEVNKICEGKPNFFDAKGLFITTFSSFMEPSEITEWFIECGRNFMVFDLNKNHSGFNITNKAIHTGLFGFIESFNIDEMNDKFINSIIDTNHQDVESNINKLNFDDIQKMSQKERQELLNQLIDSGVDRLSDEDKNLLQYLAK